MDVMDYVPYSGFVQNDEETIAIMTKAATIVPKVCDILGISLSDSESEDDENDSDDTAEVPEDRSPVQPRTDSPPVQAKPKLRAADNNNWSSSSDVDVTVGASSKPGGFVRQGCSSNGTTTATTTCEGPKTTSSAQTRIKRKRCASTPSSVGQSTSTNNTTAESSSSTSTGGGETQIGVTPPKRRRFPSISLPPTSAISQSNNMSEQEANIRRKMLEDLEVFNSQIRQLAMIEKTKNRLLEKMLFISSALKNQGRTTPTATPATNSQDNQ